jgi:proline iminopeptidase
MASEGTIPVENSGLYYREKGEGQPVIVLHGGPSFDHNYLLPDMDRLTYPSLRFIYYDQRGRGKSATNVEPETVSIESEVQDLEGLRKYFRLDLIALLGHSWGGLLAMEYAIRYPDRVSHLILLNTAPASHDDWLLTEKNLGKVKELDDLSRRLGYKEGDPDTVAEYYRIYFRPSLRRPELLERLIENLRRGFTKEGILRARKIGNRLWEETYSSKEYNLLPRLEPLKVRTLVIHGDYDLVPPACAARIAQAISGARFVLLSETGHFAYIESTNEVRKEISNFFGNR